MPFSIHNHHSRHKRKGEQFSDPGVKSVFDNVDGKIDISKVSVKNNVNTSKVGTYEITYTAYDNLNNKTVTVRKVSVVQTLFGTVQTALNGATRYIGEPSNNYLRLSNMLFRIVGVDDSKDVIIVSDEDIANVNYSKLDKWLDYYYDHINEEAKKQSEEILKGLYKN